MKARRTVLAVVLLVVLLLAGAPVAHGVTIPAGYDFFTTDYAEVEIPEIGIVPLVGVPYNPANPSPLFLLPDIPPQQSPLFHVTWLDAHGSVTNNAAHKVSQIITADPSLDPFDTIVRRNAEIDISGIGGDAYVPIEIIWLQLKSASQDGIPWPGLGLVDLYVGLHDPDRDPATSHQTVGRARLESTVGNGAHGTMDIGLKGVTTDDPEDEDYLVLPVYYDVFLVLNGIVSPEYPAHVLYSMEGLTDHFRGDTMSPSGIYTVVPEPSSFLLLGLGMLVLSGVRRRGRRFAGLRVQRRSRLNRLDC